MDTDDEYDDVEFWGGESPSNRGQPLSPHSRTERGETARPNTHDHHHYHNRHHDCNHDDDDDENKDENDEDDEIYDDDDDDDDDDDEEGSISDDIESDWGAHADGDGDGDEEPDDRMEIFGHR